MPRTIRSLSFLAVCGLVLFASGCSGNKDKIVGKWKLASIAPKDGKEQSDFGGMSIVMEFTADGNIKAGVDVNSLPAELKEIVAKDKEAAAKMGEMKQVGKYKVSGDTITFTDVEGGKGAPFGKSNGGKLKFDGDNLTITGDDGSIKLTKMK